MCFRAEGHGQRGEIGVSRTERIDSESDLDRIIARRWGG